MADNAQTGLVPTPPGAYVRTGPQTPFSLPLTPQAPYVLTGNQNQYSLMQPIAKAFGALDDMFTSLSPKAAMSLVGIGGLLLGGGIGFAAGRYMKKRR